MAVSDGFYKKIEQWVLDSQSGKIAFQPFRVDGNPYKAKILLVGASPEPNVQLNSENLHAYIHSLVSKEEFQELFYEELMFISREYKGCLNFMEWMKDNYNETVVLSYLNCLYTENPHANKKQQDPLYNKGLELLKELLNEFVPKIIIVQGASSWKQFLEQYGAQLIDLVDTKYSVQQLESKGIVAKLPLANGAVVNVVVCRSMSNFGKSGTSYGDLKQTLIKLLG